MLLIFFFNRFLLPFGLQYSLLLTPLFLFYLKEQRVLHKLKFVLIIFCGYTALHLWIGVVLKDFIVSSIVILSLLIVVLTFLEYYRKVSHVELVFKRLAQVNFGLTLMAVVALLSNKLMSVFWYLVPFTQGYKVIPRLKLFELEASHYSLAITPLFLYYFWKSLKSQGKNKEDLFYLGTLSMSLLLSFSMGVIAVVTLAIVLVLGVKLVSFLKVKKMRNLLLVCTGMGVFGILVLFFFFPENPLFYRINNLFNGLDTSGRGRTYEAIDIAMRVLENHNAFFGIGLGQFKLVGRELLIYYYQYSRVPEVVRLPNCMAETLVSFGYVGFGAKLLVQFWLFYKQKVYQNVFQLSLFFAIFIYQFTGSFLFNAMEYFIWVMVFYPKLFMFNHSNYFKL